MRVLVFCLAATLLVLGCEDNDVESQFALMETSMGPIALELFPASAPLAVQNFEGLAKRGYYNGTVFHRVIQNFIIQGGDSTGTGYGGDSIWGEPFADEFAKSLRFDRPGRVGMANAGPDTNKSQFFITLVAAPHLNDRHTIFGQVIKGMDVVDAISKVATDNFNRPIQPVVVESVSILSQQEMARFLAGG